MHKLSACSHQYSGALGKAAFSSIWQLVILRSFYKFMSKLYHISREVPRTTFKGSLIIKMTNRCWESPAFKKSSIRTGSSLKPFNHINMDYFYINNYYAQTFSTVDHLSPLLIRMSLNHRLQSPFVWLILFCVWPRGISKQCFRVWGKFILADIIILPRHVFLIISNVL